MDIDKFTREYAGNGYAEPRIIQVGEIDLFDEDVNDIEGLIVLLTEFKAKYVGADIFLQFEQGYSDEYAKARITASRMETAEETAKRAEKTRRDAAKYYEKQKETALYYSDKYLKS